MIIAHIEGANVDLARNQPQYRTLPARFEVVDGLPQFSSAHELTPEELERLNRGAKIVLTIVGERHPPCRLEVGEVPE